MRRPVTLLTSREVPDSHPFADVVKLPRDDCALQVSEPRAHGALHWAPHHDPGMASRMDTIARWVADAQPEAVVVDVSVEVAVFVRLLGIPIIVMALPGERYDAPHLLVHRLADHIVAVWPKELCVPRWLRSYEDKTSYVGGISRLDGRQIPAPRPARAQRGPFAATTVLVLGGADGLGAGPDALEQCATAQQLAPGQRWVRRKPTGPTTRGRRCGADVVVTLAGQSCIADVAAAQRPAVIIPQRRPYDEQLATARVLRQYRLAVVVRRWPEPARVARLVTQAQASGPEQLAPMEHPRAALAPPTRSRQPLDATRDGRRSEDRDDHHGARQT